MKLIENSPKVKKVKSTILVENYSPHLFWDVDKSKLNLDKRKEFLVGRVLDYGLMKDWTQLVKDLGIYQIGQIASQLRDLDPRSMSFVSLVSEIDIKDFRCFILQQSNPPHWHF